MQEAMFFWSVYWTSSAVEARRSLL